jgi:hypothetical protein
MQTVRGGVGPRAIFVDWRGALFFRLKRSAERLRADGVLRQNSVFSKQIMRA